MAFTKLKPMHLLAICYFALPKIGGKMHEEILNATAERGGLLVR